MDFRVLNGVVLHVEDLGPADRPALVFANSLGTDFRIWDDVVARLIERFRIVLYDKRGHGLSETGDSPYSIDDHVADLAALLDDLAVENAIICGLSVGGLIAQGLYASRPDLVAALILCDTAHKVGTAEAWAERMAAVEDGGIASIADAILERWFTEEFRESDPIALQGWHAMLTRTPVEGYLGTCAALRDADFTEEAKQIAVPTLCVVGEEDGATPPELVRQTADLIPGARYEVIAGSGHLPCIERPAQLTELILDFTEGNNLV
ncbi:3-oxoadipate enol-lactonase [Pelagibius marinus]|uniref:3-oxoadipate enol-lactonase n=1 Tax=Pelagibius marinus TaxID=2762760 RepID=UPI00187306B3|nr:3-oxoadipate enol-lactonase [Pelagibius marinus]